MEPRLTEFRELFGLKEQDVRTYSPLTLAYIGDAIYELVIRTVLVSRGNCPVNQLHRRAAALVKASAQSAMIGVLEPLLSPEERGIYRRGRNAHSPTMAKHATMADYRRATGFEALMGYLYLSGGYDRMLQLIRTGIEHVEAAGGKHD
ncbi:MAG: ribonuclease III [Blautia sp.]|nr:ribonuclease III [Blautia sp.]